MPTRTIVLRDKSVLDDCFRVPMNQDALSGETIQTSTSELKIIKVSNLRTSDKSRPLICG